MAYVHKTRFILLMLVVMFMTSIALMNAADAKPNPKYASIVIDADTGAILSHRYADKKLHPASLTKVMTIMMAFDAMRAGKLSAYDRIRMSPYAASMVPSKLGLKPGETIRVKDAINILVTKSANDVAVALAEHIGGTEYRFAKMMTAKAHSMGMKSTYFRNASGLHHAKQVSTARDMARMARVLINNYGSYYHYFSKTSFRYKGKTYQNHNRLMRSYKGMDGLKTGYISKSGFNLVASAKRDGNRIIGVVFGGRTSKSRNAHMKLILDRGFKKMDVMHLADLRNMKRPVKRPETSTVYASAYSPSADSAKKNNQLAPASGSFKTAMQNIYATSSTGSVKAPIKADRSQWSVQIGAFKSRVKTDNLLQDALKILPKDLLGAYPIIAPLRTATSGWMFRARLAGLTKSQAQSACRYFNDCLVVAPR